MKTTGRAGLVATVSGVRGTMWLFTITVSLVLGASANLASAKTFTPTGWGWWGTPGNWDPHGVPAAGHIAIIDSGGAAEINLTQPTFYRLLIGREVVWSGTLTVSGTGVASGWATVGDGGTGTLNINPGNSFQNSVGVMGGASSGRGTANVSGIWKNTTDLTVGWWGQGSLNIHNGGTVDGGEFIAIAREGAASRGAVTVNSGGLLTTANWIDIGAAGIGVLNVPGGTVNAGAAIRVGPGSTLSLNNGTVRAGTLERDAWSVFSDNAGSLVQVNALTGAGWGTAPTFSGSLRLGHSGGTGSHTVPGGGNLISGGWLDVGFNSVGTVTVDGILAAKHLSIGTVAGSGNGTVTIQTGGSAFANAAGGGWTRVGWYGNGSLNIHAGGSLTNAAGVIGSDTTSVGAATVSGNWTNTGNLTVGEWGAGNLTINSGGVVDGGRSVRIARHGAGAVTVHGGGTLTAAGWVNVGYGGVGTMTVAGNLTSEHLHIGSVAGPGSGTVTIQTGGLARADAVGGGWTRVGWGGNGSLNIHAGGTLTNAVGVIGGDTISVGAATVSGNWTNTGDLTVGEWGAGNLTINSGGVVSGGNFIGIARGDPTSHGTVTVNSGGTLSAHGFMGVGHMDVGEGGTGTLIVSGGTVSVGTTMFVGANDTVNLNSGSLAAAIVNMTGNAAFNFNGGELRIGTFNGNLNNLGGTLSPGSSPGLTTINGSYTQSAPGTLKIELGGVTPGTLYDVLNVTGALTLDGTLAVSLWGGFSPSFGNTFDILDWGSRGGVFSTVTLPTLGAGLEWDQSGLYSGGVISVIPEPSTFGLLGAALLAFLARRKFKRPGASRE